MTKRALVHCSSRRIPLSRISTVALAAAENCSRDKLERALAFARPTPEVKSAAFDVGEAKQRSCERQAQGAHEIAANPARLGDIAAPCPEPARLAHSGELRFRARTQD